MLLRRIILQLCYFFLDVFPTRLRQVWKLPFFADKIPTFILNLSTIKNKISPDNKFETTQQLVRFAQKVWTSFIATCGPRYLGLQSFIHLKSLLK
jgi:hypothetical protein